MSSGDRVVRVPLRSRVLTAAMLALAAAVPAVAASSPPPFRSSVSTLTAAERAAMTPSAWRPGCPVGPASLRVVRVSHWDFSGRARTGRIVVHRDVANQVVSIMRQLYAARYPIRWMVPIERFGGSDFRSIEADNTSCVQLPLRRRHTAVVGARLRARDRHQPDREPVRLGREHVPSGQRALRAPNPAAAGDDRRR